LNTTVVHNISFSGSEWSSDYWAIEAAGAILLYLPPYLPDFNPIEMLFAKLKALLRTAAERTIASLGTQLAVYWTTPPPDEAPAILLIMDTARHNRH
jgi:hypothetical protein